VSDLYRYNTKPPYGTPLDPRHPLVKGARLAQFFAFNSSAPILREVDLVEGKAISTAGTNYNLIAPVQTPYGMAYQWPANNARFNIPPLGITDPYSWACGLNIGVVAAGQYQLLIGNITATNGIYLVNSSLSGNVPKMTVYGNGADHLSNTQLISNSWYVLGISYANNIGTFYVNGVPDGGTSATLPWRSDYMAIGDDNHGEGFNNAQVSWMAVWGSRLSDRDHALIGSSPSAIWQLLAAPPSLSRTIVRVPAAPSLVAMPVQFPWCRTSKPPYGARINQYHPLAQGLAGFYALNEGAGLKVNDASPGAFPLSRAGSPVWTMTSSGSGMKVPTLNDGFRATGIPQSKLTYPMTIACGFRILSTVGGARFFGITSDFSTASDVITLTWNTTASIFAANGSSRVIMTNIGPMPAIGSDAVMAATVTSRPGGGGDYYLNGVASPHFTATCNNPTYGGNYGPGIGILPYGQVGAALSAVYYWMAWWLRELTPAEHVFIGSNVNAIWQFLAPPLTRGWVVGGRLFRRTEFLRSGSRSVA
jgi:hypothetical protein